MRAIQITGYGDTDRLVLGEFPDPQPGPGEVAIDVAVFGVNFADVLARVGLYVQAPRPPFTPGFEVAGTVAAVGPGVTGLKAGDRVVSLTEFGGYASRVVVPAMAACPVPPSLSLEEAAGLTVTGVTAYHSLLVQGAVAPDEWVLVQAAAGGVGLTALQLAQNAGARVIGACGGARKVSFLRDFGLEHVIDYRSEDVPARIRAITGAGGLDVIVDSVGSGFVRTGLDLLGPGGRFIAIGAANFAPTRTRSIWQLAREYIRTPRLHPLTLLGQSKSYIGVQMLVLGRQKPGVLRRALEAVLAEAAAGRIRTVIDRVLPAAQIGEAHRLMQARQTVGKLVVTWQ